MKNYICTGHSALLTMQDNDVNTISTLAYTGTNIDWSWVIEEDGNLIFEGESYPVKKGDIVLLLYANYKEGKESRKNREIAILSNDKLYEVWLKNKQYEDELMSKRAKHCDECGPCVESIE